MEGAGGNRDLATRAGERWEKSMTASEMTFERHFSVDELSALWGMSDDFVRRLFLHEPGVVVFCHYRPGRRVYRTLRIPESVAQRIHTRMRKPA
jgi:hypothetical protein